MSVTKNSFGNVKKIILKLENTQFLHINTYLWKLWFKFQFQLCQELYQKQSGFKFIEKILFALRKNSLLLWRGHFFRPCNLVLIPQFSKRSKLYHFNVLKCNLCFTINIWQKFNHLQDNFSLETFTCCGGDIYCFFLDLKTNHYYRFMKDNDS